MIAVLTCECRCSSDPLPELSSNLGVKQGDRMSPLLFGMFVDGVEGAQKHVATHAAGTVPGVELDG